MELYALASFLGVVAVAGYVQTVWGFALGIIVIGMVALFDIVPVAFAAVVVSILGVLNAAFVLYRIYRYVRWGVVVSAAVGLVPAVALGVALLDNFSANSTRYLNIVLAVFILIVAVLSILRPQPRAIPSPNIATFVVGLVGGLFSGLFSSGGPPIAYHLYKQPYPLITVRATLLAIVAIATSLRICYIGSRSGITTEMVALSSFSLPIVVGSIVVGRRFAPQLSDMNMRRVAFSLLLLMGIMLLVKANL